MGPTEIGFERRAGRRYELGRVRWAARMLLFVLPVPAIALLIGRPALLVLFTASALALLAFALAFTHLRYERAVLSGIIAGLPALLLPWIFNASGEVCIAGSCFDLCIPSCLVSGALAGLWAAFRAAKEERHWSFWFAALLAAGLTGALGCSVAGKGGMLGLVAGLVAGTAPVLVRAELRRG